MLVNKTSSSQGLRHKSRRAETDWSDGSSAEHDRVKWLGTNQQLLLTRMTRWEAIRELKTGKQIKIS